MGKSKGGGGGGGCAGNNNRANQMNPNNAAFYQSRGVSTRPGNWQSHASHADSTMSRSIRTSACEASASSAQSRAAFAADMRAVNQVVQSGGFGGQAHKAGSQAKHTNVAGRSDLDVRVYSQNGSGFSRSAHQGLAQAFRNDSHFSQVDTSSNPNVIKLQGKSGGVDVRLNSADGGALASGYKTGPVKNGFHNNQVGQDVARHLKANYDVRGVEAESAVLRAQQQNRGAERAGIFGAAKDLLGV